MKHLTAVAWHLPNKRRYGAPESYVIAAQWLAPCAVVADWGGGGGYFRAFSSTPVCVVDGTQQRGVDVVADLAAYRAQSAGILLRHVVDNTFDWAAVLGNAIAAFAQRMVVVTYTPDVVTSAIAYWQGSWPVWHFNPDDLRALMAPFLVREVLTAAPPERVYLLERAA